MIKFNKPKPKANVYAAIAGLAALLIGLLMPFLITCFMKVSNADRGKIVLFLFAFMAFAVLSLVGFYWL